MIHLKLLIFLVLIFCLSSCSAHNDSKVERAKTDGYDCGINPELIHSWVNLEKLDTREAPFHEIYTGCEKTLIYVAARHGNDPESETFKLIEKLFEDYPIEFAIAEGFPSEMGRSPQNMIDYAKGTEATPGDAEPYLTIRKTSTKGAVFQGGEPSDKQIMDEVVKDSISPVDLLGFYIVRQIPQLVRREQIKDAKDPRLNDEIFNIVGSFSEATGVPIKELKDVDGLTEFSNWYEATNGVSFNEGYRDEDSWPGVAPSSKPRPTNRISDKVVDARDQHIIGVIDAALREFDTVIVVYGSGHYMIHEPALKAAFIKRE